MSDIKTENELPDNATDSEKLTKIVNYLDSLEDEAMEQSKSLRRIKNVIEIFVILFVIGIIIQSCSIR